MDGVLSLRDVGWLACLAWGWHLRPGSLSQDEPETTMPTEATTPSDDRSATASADARVVNAGLRAGTRPDATVDATSSSLVKLDHDEWSELCADLERWLTPDAKDASRRGS
jgi:hypothetical protein